MRPPFTQQKLDSLTGSILLFRNLISRSPIKFFFIDIFLGIECLSPNQFLVSCPTPTKFIKIGFNSFYMILCSDSKKFLKVVSGYKTVHSFKISCIKNSFEYVMSLNYVKWIKTWELGMSARKYLNIRW